MPNRLRCHWRKHSLSYILLFFIAVSLVWSLWATFHEFRTNEQAGASVKHGFWSTTFWFYYAAQIGTNYVPELMGLLTAVLLTKRWREYGSAESD